LIEFIEANIGIIRYTEIYFIVYLFCFINVNTFLINADILCPINAVIFFYKSLAQKLIYLAMNEWSNK
jgi:hypothetical protein